MSHSDDEDGGRRRAQRCGGCGQESAGLRRGLCAACYARWVRARPVGLGATCAACAERRPERLRHFELRGLWVVLCHGCGTVAERVTPSPRSLDGLLLMLRRKRPLAEPTGLAGRRQAEVPPLDVDDPAADPTADPRQDRACLDADDDRQLTVVRPAPWH
jgi:hypothetical protein